MKLVSINTAPSVSNCDGTIRADVTDIGKILDNIDNAVGLPDAIRSYVYALRDLQRANDEYAIDGGDRIAIDHAEAAVKAAFDRLIATEFTLNRGAAGG